MFKGNFGVSVISTAPSPALSGTELIVNAGDGTNFTDVPFFATVWPADEVPSFDNAEVVLVTEVDTDTFTIVRAQKNTTAKSIASGWAIINAIYAEDVQGGAGYLFVAASNASDYDKGRANYVCDGTADDVEIQAAIDEIIGTGGVVQLSIGEFNLANDLEIDGLLSSLPNPSEQAFTCSLLGSGNQGTDLLMASGEDGILLTGTPMVRVENMRIFIAGDGNGIRSVVNTGSFRGFWNSSFKNLSIIGDFDTHSGWAMNLDGPFRSTFENIEANGVGNGIRLAATDTEFNPGNLLFMRCFMDLNGADNGVAYELYTPDEGGSFNICTFIQCEGIDGNASTTSVGWHLRGSPTEFYSSKNIKIIQSNMEDFNIAVKLEHAEDNYIQMSWSNTKDNGKLFEADAQSSGNELYCTTSYVAPGNEMTFIDDNNTTADRPNVVGHSTIYVDTGANLVGAPGTDTIIDRMRVWGPGTWDSVLDGYWVWANNLGGVKVTGAPTTGQVLTATSATAAEWDDPAGGAGTVDTANSPAANEFARFTDANTIEGRTYAEARADLDLEVGTDIQAYDADLAAIAALSPTNNDFLVRNAGAWANRTPTQAIAHLGLDADLATFSLPASTTISAFGATVIDDADAATARTTLGLGTSANPQFATIELGAATDTTISRSAAGVIAVEGVVIPSISSTNTFTNKRITKRVASTASSATPTPSADNDDQYQLTALAANATWGAPTGTPTSGQPLILRWKDNGTSRTLTWNAIYRGIVAALPAATTISKTHYAAFIYNGADSKWDMVAYITEP